LNNELLNIDSVTVYKVVD